MRARLLALVVSGLTALTAALWLRYVLVEQEGMDLLCKQAIDSRCALREAVIAVFTHHRLGYLSLTLALLGLLPWLRPLAWLGWFGGIAGLVLYCFDTSAPAALLALLVLARAPASKTQSANQA